MPIYKEKAYARIRASLDTDPANLTEELIRFPAALTESLDCLYEAQAVQRRAEHDHRIFEAEVAVEWRDAISGEGGKATNDAVAARVAVDERVIQSRNAIEDARANVYYWSALVDGMRSKQSSLKRISDQVITGYLAPSSTYAGKAARQVEEMREEMAEARREGRRRIGQPT